MNNSSFSSFSKIYVQSPFFSTARDEVDELFGRPSVLSRKNSAQDDQIYSNGQDTTAHLETGDANGNFFGTFFNHDHSDD